MNVQSTRTSQGAASRPLPFTRWCAVMLVAVATLASPASTQAQVSDASPNLSNASSEVPADSAKPPRKFMTRRDLAYSAAALAATAAIAPFDVRIAHWWQQPSVQGSAARNDLVHSLTVVNEMPLTIAAVATYGAGRLLHSPTTADVGAHWTEAMVLTVALSELIRVPVGRARPRVSPDDQYQFDVGAGFNKFENRSFPSLHSAVGFATAAVLVGEMRERNSDAVRIAAPLLYAGATIPGITRMYLNQHWGSDVFAGAFLGALIGTRVVQYGHSRRTKLDKFLLGAVPLPDGQGGLRVAFSITP